MIRFFAAFLLSCMLGAPAQAWTTDTGRFDTLQFVTETGITAADGIQLSLCHKIAETRIIGLSVAREIKGYALSRDGCVAQTNGDFGAQQMEAAQSLALIDANLPSTPAQTPLRVLQAYGLWIAIGLALFAVIWRRLKSLLGLDPKAPLRKKATQRILTAMCHMGKCDGIVSSAEIAVITQHAARLTRSKIQAPEVIRIVDHLKAALSAQDFVDLGKGLRDSEKDLMMRGVFVVAFANGRIIASEYDFLTDLAYGIGMPAGDFRRVMNLALADLDRGDAQTLA